VRFDTAHKFTLIAHSVKAYQELGRPAAGPDLDPHPKALMPRTHA
jgi:uncharacterized protein YbgA (DUF1722 family)